VFCFGKKYINNCLQIFFVLWSLVSSVFKAAFYFSCFFIEISFCFFAMKTAFSFIPFNNIPDVLLQHKMIVEFAAVSLSTAILIAASILPYIGLRRGSESPHGKPKALSGLALSNCFACGIFLGTCFLGLIPHVQMQENVILKQLNISDPHSQEYPYLRTNFVILSGFLIILLIEQVAFLCAPNSASTTDAHYHPPDIAARQNNGLHDSDSNQPLVLLDSDSEPDELEEIQFRTAEPQHPHHDHSHDEHGGHHHHVLPGDTGSIEYILLLIALSVHSIFEGIALGAQKEFNGFMKFLLSIMVHEVLCSFAYGVSLSKQKIPLKKAFGSILFLSFSLPIGLLIMLWVCY
jgi:zinc transporter ZupT